MLEYLAPIKINPGIDIMKNLESIHLKSINELEHELKNERGNSPTDCFTLELIMNQDQSAFFYFVVDASDNLATISTIWNDQSRKETCLQLNFHLSLQNEVISMLKHLQKSIPFKIFIRN